jgi:2-hydroxychromene-2-carboxylate isomerase
MNASVSTGVSAGPNKSGKSVEFFFDFGSPTTYLAYSQLPKIAAECKAEIVWRPMLLGGVFKATGNASPVMVPAKGRWMLEDLGRWARRYGVPYQLNPHFPINTLTLMRGAAGYQLRQPAAFARYVDLIFRGMWTEARNLGDATVLAETLGQAGLDATAFAAMVGDPEVKAALVANTEAAVARGAFGAPTMFVGDQMFFGQDRLDFVREALA